MSNDVILSAFEPKVGEIKTIHYQHLGTVKTFHVYLAGTGAVSADVKLEVANNVSQFLTDTESVFTISGTSAVSEGKVLVGSWNFIRATCTAISGTDAILTITMGS